MKETIRYLKSKGDVFLVRMPVHYEILNIENKLDLLFDLKIYNLSQEFSISYFNFNDNNKKYQFKDGIHLTVESAQELSKDLANRIKLIN